MIAVLAAFSAAASAYARAKGEPEDLTPPKRDWLLLAVEVAIIAGPALLLGCAIFAIIKFAFAYNGLKFP